MYSYVGWAWTQGKLPYADAWDNKGPVIYAVSAARSALLGSAPEDIGVQEIVFGLLTALMLAVLAYRLADGVASATALAMGTLFWAGLTPGANVDNGATSILALLSTGAVLLAVSAALAEQSRRRQMLLVAFGALEGLLFMSKANAIATLPMALLVLVVMKRERRVLGYAALAVAVGFLVPVAAFAIYFWRHGALGDLLEGAFIFDVTRARAGFQMGVTPALAVRAADYLHSAKLLVPILAVAMALAWRLVMPPDRNAADRSRLALVVVGAWLFFAFVEFVSNAGLFRSHSFNLFPPIVLGAAWMTSLESGQRDSARFLSPMRAVVLFLLVVPMALHVAAAPRGSTKKGPWRRMADVLSRTTAPTDRFLTFTGWAEASILSTAHRQSASRFFYPFPLHLMGAFKDRAWQEILAALQQPGKLRGVLTESLGAPIPSTGPTVQWALTNMRTPLIPQGMTDADVPEARREVRKILMDSYRVEHCEGNICLLSRRPDAGAPDSAGVRALGNRRG